VDELWEEGEDRIWENNYWEDPRVVTWCNEVNSCQHKYPIINFQGQTEENLNISYFALRSLLKKK